MKRLLNALWYDILFQFRHGFYFAYLFVTIFYLIILHYLPDAGAEKAIPFILFTDISVLGFFFIGGILLLEKGQHALEALFVTPLRISEYLLAKYISLSILATIATVSLYFAVGGSFSFLPFLLLIVWGNMFLYTLFGIALVSNVKNVNHYFIYGVPMGVTLFIPLLSFFDIWEFPLLYLLPTEPTLELLCGDFSWAAVAVMMVWIFLAWRIGYKQFATKIVGREVA